ncbi:MAG: hypothetical protein R2744_09005 [Bacteroidales bacterium]
MSEGYLVTVDVSDGEVVAAGQKLATMIVENKMVLKAEVLLQIWKLFLK